MRLRWLICVLVVVLSWNSGNAARIPRQADGISYKPPLLLGAPPAPVSSATIQNSYQPPIPLSRSNDFQSSVNSARSYSPYTSSQGYNLPNQPPQPLSYSVQYTPPAQAQQPNSGFKQPGEQPIQSLATSYSVHQQPSHGIGHDGSQHQSWGLNRDVPHQQSQSISQGSQRQPFAILSDNSGLPQSTAERTYSTHSKVVGSAPTQAIHKSPASEIQADKGQLAKDKDNKNDEYVVYYYYYYDNDTAPSNNLSLNFDDIPSLEAYDNDKSVKEPEKSASARTLAANVNSLEEPMRTNFQTTEPSSSQPRSAPTGDREAYIRADSLSKPLEETVIQPLKPVSNVFRYGSNEVPRFPVIPNFIVSEALTTTLPGDSLSPNTLTESPTTPPTQVNSQQPDFNIKDSEDDDLNNVLDNTSDLKPSEEKAAEEISTTTTTEPTTTTEVPTTTTSEKPRRRPSLGGGSRRRFNPSSAPSLSPSRSRTPSSSSRGSSTTSSSSTSSTTTSTTPTRRSFGSNRVRPRPPVGGNRPRTNSRTTESGDDKVEGRTSDSTTVSTSTSRSRFSASSTAAPRRFQSSRSRSQTSSTSTTTRSPTSPSSRSRPSSRPRPNLVTRNRPARPGFLRPRPGSEPEEPEVTTPASSPTEEETSPAENSEEVSTNEEENDSDEEEETSKEEDEEVTTTEASRFSALFRPRNRNSLGNRPRPVIGNRPARS